MFFIKIYTVCKYANLKLLKTIRIKEKFVYGWNKHKSKINDFKKRKTKIKSKLVLKKLNKIDKPL